jgi:hypothetical protein
LTDEARLGTDSIIGDIAIACGRIHEVMSHVGGDLVGLELPCRMTLVLDGVPINFASHIDALVRHSWGYSILDWKWRMDSPTQAGLDRDLQLGMYRLMADRGHFLIGGGWRVLEGRARVGIVHLPYLRPVGRKTSWVDPETGEQIELLKGDARPIERAVRWANHRHLVAIVSAFEERVRMIRAGLFPAMPSMVECMTCESEAWCSRFDRQTAWETRTEND